MNAIEGVAVRKAEILPLGDMALLVRFGAGVSDDANQAALALAARLQNDAIAGVVEIVPSLVSVLVRYEPDRVSQARLAGEIGLRLGPAVAASTPTLHTLGIRFDGPDFEYVCNALALEPADFIARHNFGPLRVLTTGFAPGFVYCGMHEAGLVLPRRAEVRPVVPEGSVLFAAGQTAIAATDIPTGWHVIGSTDFRNFRPEQDPPTILQAGDLVQFKVAP